jgi:uncharacterized membrane protein YccC
VSYTLVGTRERIREKAVGTALGACAAAVVAILAPPARVLTGSAILAFLLALVQRAVYRRMYGLSTFSLVLYLAAPDDVVLEVEQRGVQILAGIVLHIVGLAVLHAVGDRLAKAAPSPVLAATLRPL